MEKKPGEQWRETREYSSLKKATTYIEYKEGEARLKIVSRSRNKSLTCWKLIYTNIVKRTCSIAKRRQRYQVYLILVAISLSLSTWSAASIKTPGIVIHAPLLCVWLCQTGKVTLYTYTYHFKNEIRIVWLFCLFAGVPVQPAAVLGMPYVHCLIYVLVDWLIFYCGLLSSIYRNRGLEWPMPPRRWLIRSRLEKNFGIEYFSSKTRQSSILNLKVYIYNFNYKTITIWFWAYMLYDSFR